MYISLFNHENISAPSDKLPTIGVCNARIERRYRHVNNITSFRAPFQDALRSFDQSNDIGSRSELRSVFLDRRLLQDFIRSIDNGGRIISGNARYSQSIFKDALLKTYPNITFLGQVILFKIFDKIGIINNDYEIVYRKVIELPRTPDLSTLIRQATLAGFAEELDDLINKKTSKFSIPKGQFSMLSLNDAIGEVLQVIATKFEVLNYDERQYMALFDVIKRYIFDDPSVIALFGPLGKNPALQALMSNSTIVRLALDINSPNVLNGAMYSDIKPFEIDAIATKFSRNLLNMVDFQVTSDYSLPSTIFRTFNSDRICGGIIGEREVPCLDVSTYAGYSYSGDARLVSNFGTNYNKQFKISNVHLQELPQFNTRGNIVEAADISDTIEVIHASVLPAVFSAKVGPICGTTLAVTCYTSYYDTMVDKLLMRTVVQLTPWNETKKHSVSNKGSDKNVDADVGINDIAVQDDKLITEYMGSKYILEFLPDAARSGLFNLTIPVNAGFFVDSPLIAALSFGNEVDRTPVNTEKPKESLTGSRVFFGDLLTDKSIIKGKNLFITIASPTLMGENSMRLNLLGRRSTIDPAVMCFIDRGWLDLYKQIAALQTYSNVDYFDKFVARGQINVGEATVLNKDVKAAINETIYAHFSNLVIKSFNESFYLRSLLIEALTVAYSKFASTGEDKSSFSPFMNVYVVGEMALSIFLGFLATMANLFDTNNDELIDMRKHLARRTADIGISLSSSILSIRGTVNAEGQTTK